MSARMSTLRLRLVIAFMLVSVPAMLASTYVAARLISGAFEQNVAQWLGETSRFFRLEVMDATQEAQRVATVIGQRLERTNHSDLTAPRAIEHEFQLLNSVGYDLIAIYDENRTVLFSSRSFTPDAPLPTRSGEGIFKVRANETHLIMAGAVQEIHVKGQAAYVLVGSWLDESYLGGIRVVTSLDVRLFADFGDELVPVLQTHPERTAPIPQAVRAQLASGEEDEIFDGQADAGRYRAVYAGFRGIDGKLAAIGFIGLSRDAGFFEQLSRRSLFFGIFAFGCLISVLVGILMSDLLVRPLRALTRGVRAIASGDFGHRVPAGSGGHELNQLAAGFNGMAEQLGKLQELEGELRRRDRLSALGQAATVIAHEVRNPLGIIKTSTEVVRNRAKLAGSEDRMLGYVIDEVRRIETLVRDFLDFAQPKAPVTTELPMRAIIDRVAAVAAPELSRRKVAIAVADDSGGATILGDPDQLHQACLNLVLNAIDAMPEGGAIHASVTATENCVSLTIRDEGPGVAPEIREQIFNPFFTTKAKGTGLGLAKVQTVAESHGGSASCTSEPGRGASFTLTLPRPDSGARA
ncbi:MAG: HAMP domain-containing histidine kinase [Bosea sp. (in: a-proteobacteria)]|nr:MAG: HAMP domain-containing histidine kinase [Bosea sp. (in: a-proteobacteria)]SIR16174.1 Signal transduction histidine kinase [Bosea sp. TND4EK4]